MDEQASELFADATGLTQYEIAHGVSRTVALRHRAIRRLIAEAGGIVPTTADLALSLRMKGFRISKQTVRNDLREMGWR